MTYDWEDEQAASEYLQAVFASNLDPITIEGMAIVIRNYLQQVGAVPEAVGKQAVVSTRR